MSNPIRVVNLPWEEQVRSADFLRVMKHSIDNNPLVPNNLRRAAYDYVTDRICDLAIRRVFRDYQIIAPIDYSQFFVRHFTVQTTTTDSYLFVHGRLAAVRRDVVLKVLAAENGP